MTFPKNRFLLLLLTVLLAGCTNDPLPYADSRPMLLTFGLYVTPDPAHNPISPPERFIGYHTGLDFEIFPGEAEKEVPVSAVCDGTVLVSEFAEGYGGVLVQSCVLDGQDVTVLYGHLLLSSLTKKDTVVKRGDRLAVLAPARSHDSDGNRKHLHLDIHKGKEIVLLGYVQEQKELDQFLDPADVLGFSISS